MSKRSHSLEIERKSRTKEAGSSEKEMQMTKEGAGNQKRRIVNYDVLNIVCILVVVLMHHNTLVHSYSNTAAWKQALVVENAFYFTVPCFFMLSGAKLMRYRDRYDTKTFLKKRISKVMIPYFFWGTVIIILRELIGRSVLTSFSLRGILDAYFNHRFAGTYYFFPAIVTLYLLLPVLSHLADRRKTLWYIAGTIFVFQSFLPMLAAMAGIEWTAGWESGITVRAVHLILGYLLASEMPDKKTRLKIYVAGVGIELVRFFLILILSIRQGAEYTVLNSSYYAPGVLYAAAAFTFFISMDMSRIEKNEKLVRVIQTLSGATFGIYMIHNTIIMPVLQMVLHLGDESFFWRTGAFLLTYSISAVIVLVMKKIPVVNIFVP